MHCESHAAYKEGILPSTRIRNGQGGKGQRRNFQMVKPGAMKNNGQKSFSQKANLRSILETVLTPRARFSRSLLIRIEHLYIPATAI